MKTTISTRLMHTLYGGKKRLGSEALLRLSHFVESQKTEGDRLICTILRSAGFCHTYWALI